MQAEQFSFFCREWQVGFDAGCPEAREQMRQPLLSLGFPFFSCDIGSVGVLRHVRRYQSEDSSRA